MKRPKRADLGPRELDVTRIGITTYAERARWSVWDRSVALLPEEYVGALRSAGALPVLLPPAPGLARAAVRSLDALVIAGGPDIDPGRYGAPRHQLTGTANDDRDEWELALLREALDIDLQVLAVCRGMQALNVALGGTLHQHLPEVGGTESHQPILGTFGTTSVEVVPGSRLHDVVGEAVSVRCHHHQSLDRVATGLDVTASAADGIVEAVEVADASFVIGVQWHPEENPADSRLFHALRDAATGRLPATPERGGPA